MLRIKTLTAQAACCRALMVHGGLSFMLLASMVQAEDPIESELQMQRAIAESIQGDHSGAANLLGDADDTAGLYAKAMFLMESMETKDLEAGVRILEEIVDRADAPSETRKFLSVGYLHLGKVEQSAAAAEEYLRGHPLDKYAHYIHGLAMLKDQPEAGKEALRQAGYDDDGIAKIQTVAMQVPVDVMQRRNTIGSTIATPQRRSGATRAQGCNGNRPYNFTLLLAGEYDSNVPLQSNFSGLGAIEKKDDYRFLMAAFLDLQLLSTDQFNLGAIGSAYDTFQFDLGQYNIQDYMGGFYTNAVLAEHWIGSFRYEFHETLVDEQQFAMEHRLTPSLTRLAERGHTTMFYEFNPIDSEAPALIPAQNQTADINRIGITQAIYTFGGQGRIYGGYQFYDASADGSDFDRDGHMVTGRVERPLGRGWITDFDARFAWDNYKNPNSLDFFDDVRNDERLELRMGVQKNFSQPVSLRLDYTYINSNSNTENLFGVRFYDYDRHILSTQLIFTL